MKCTNIYNTFFQIFVKENYQELVLYYYLFSPSEMMAELDWGDLVDVRIPQRDYDTFFSVL